MELLPNSIKTRCGYVQRTADEGEGGMSRSYRKTPCYGITGGSHNGAQKLWRSKENRAKRKKFKNLLKNVDVTADLLFPHEKEYGNEWASPRDGKVYDRDFTNLRAAWKRYKKAVISKSHPIDLMFMKASIKIMGK